MNRVYRNRTKTSVGLAVCIVVVVVFAIMWLQPHVKALVFAQYTRQAAFENLLQQVKGSQDIDEKTFWEFRERYAPGSFTFSEGVAFLGTQVIQKLPAADEPLHTFTSPGMISRDFILRRDPNLQAVDQAKQFLETQYPLPSSEEILFRNESNLLYKTEDGKIILFFYRPIEELYAVDGLFDFTDEERELLEESFWVNLTILE